MATGLKLENDEIEQWVFAAWKAPFFFWGKSASWKMLVQQLAV